VTDDDPLGLKHVAKIKKYNSCVNGFYSVVKLQALITSVLSSVGQSTVSQNYDSYI